MAKIIGLDFGNFNSFPCFISSFDQEDRISGQVHDLTSPNPDQRFGIPSVFFYSRETGILCCTDATKARARPIENRLRYLKRRLYDDVTLDGKHFIIGEAITHVIQQVIRDANRELQNGWQETTNEIALAYPASFTYTDRQYLVELAENATLEDGTHLHVCGTIAEPAAAALDYLAREDAPARNAATVLTYDLGGGTFDLALVVANPQGWQRKDGSRYYYQVIGTEGLGDLGGLDFDRRLEALVLSKVTGRLTTSARQRLHRDIEALKIELSQREEADIEVGDDEYVTVTRQEFEGAVRDLLDRTVDFTRDFLGQFPNQQPEVILLSGGASQMPMVQQGLEQALPQYRDQIINYRPNHAIAYGTARFGTAEPSPDAMAGDEVQVHRSIVSQSTRRDLGFLFTHPDTRKNYIGYIIPAGTELPYDGGFGPCHLISPADSVNFTVCEANGPDPDPENPQGDYHPMLTLSLHFSGEKPAGYTLQSRMLLDARGLLTAIARDVHQDENLEVQQEMILPVHD